jgi:hypothetical protein
LYQAFREGGDLAGLASALRTFSPRNSATFTAHHVASSWGSLLHIFRRSRRTKQPQQLPQSQQKHCIRKCKPTPSIAQPHTRRQMSAEPNWRCWIIHRGWQISNLLVFPRKLLKSRHTTLGSAFRTPERSWKYSSMAACRCCFGSIIRCRMMQMQRM